MQKYVRLVCKSGFLFFDEPFDCEIILDSPGFGLYILFGEPLWTNQPIHVEQYMSLAYEACCVHAVGLKWAILYSVLSEFFCEHVLYVPIAAKHHSIPLLGFLK